MKGLIISIISVLFLFGCSDETFDETKINTPEEVQKDNLSYVYEDVKYACELGCRYDFDLYSVANSLRKESVSLNTEQLESIKARCNTVCEKKVLDAVIKRIKLEREHYENQEVKGFDSSKVPKDKKVNKELIPFEDL